MCVPPAPAIQLVPQPVNPMNHAAILPLCHSLATIPPELGEMKNFLRIKRHRCKVQEQVSSSLEVAGLTVMLSVHGSRAERFRAAACTREPR